MKKYLSRFISFIKDHKKFCLVAVVVFLTLGYFGRKIFAQQANKVTYQTALVERGTLVSSVSASGVISAGGTNDIITKASGVVKEVYVKNGETVKKSQKIATLTLDDEALSRQTIAWAAYIEAINAGKTAETNKVAADIQMWKDRQAIFDALEDQDYKNNNAVNPDTKKTYTDSEKVIIDKTVERSRKAFEASETAYKNADALISKTKAQISTAWRNYQQSSSTVSAPTSGIVSNFSLAPGVIIVSAYAAEGSAVSSQKLGFIINPSTQYQATVNLTEIDVVKVKPSLSVTLTLDAFPDHSFTGKVLSIDTAGKVSSGVTSYPTTILLSPTTVNIYPNMSVTANIIVNSKTNVLLVPNSAIQSQNGETTVRILDNKELHYIPVEIGMSSDNQTEIISGISEGVEVITAVIDNSARTSSQTGSPFGTIRMGGMGGNVIKQR